MLVLLFHCQFHFNAKSTLVLRSGLQLGILVSFLFLLCEVKVAHVTSHIISHVTSHIISHTTQW